MGALSEQWAIAGMSIAPETKRAKRCLIDWQQCQRCCCHLPLGPSLQPATPSFRLPGYLSRPLPLHGDSPAHAHSTRTAAGAQQPIVNGIDVVAAPAACRRTRVSAMAMQDTAVIGGAAAGLLAPPLLLWRACSKLRCCPRAPGRLSGCGAPPRTKWLRWAPRPAPALLAAPCGLYMR